MKLWFYTLTDGRVQDSMIVTHDDDISEEGFIAILREVCHGFDSATPMVLAGHFKHFQKFSIVRFKPSDYVEQVNYDSMNIELVKEDVKKKPSF